MLSDEHLKDYCLPNKGEKTCRYLCSDIKNLGVFYCLKKSSKKQIIDFEIKSFIAKCAINNVDFNSYDLPIADNCSGFHLLKSIKQGHDVS
jgi:hypothetical protein